MPRPRSKKSNYPFAGLGLDKDEEVILKQLLGKKHKDTSARRLVRFLVRKWIKENEYLLKEEPKTKSH